MGQRTRTDGVAAVARDQEDLYSRRNRGARRNVHHYLLLASRISKQEESSASIACSWLVANPEVERRAGMLLECPPVSQCGGASFAPLGRTNFVYFHAATATCGTVIVNGLWCSKARSRRPTIVYFGLWVGGRKAAISLRKWW